MKPILFNTEMVRAILEGRKTITRRAIKPNQFDGECPLDVETLIDGKELMCKPWKSMTDLEIIHESYKPPYRVGDVLYVRETWNVDRVHTEESKIGVRYKADDSFAWVDVSEEKYDKYDRSIAESNFDSWRPSIHMPKEAARIFLKVTDARVEKLWDITFEGIAEEGVNPRHFEDENSVNVKDFVNAYIYLWDSTIKKEDLQLYGWDANPWVFVIEFERCEKPESEEI